MDQDKVRKCLHDLNNRVGMVLAHAELLQLDSLSAKALERTKVIEQQALEIRDLLRDLSGELFS
jgi:hypothetical protein